jgi:hypothetical protein
MAQRYDYLLYEAIVGGDLLEKKTALGVEMHGCASPPLPLSEL